MTDDSTYLRWLRDGLAKPGKTQKGLARALDIDAMGVSRLVHGKRRFQIGELQKISQYLAEPLPSTNVALTLHPKLGGVRVMGRVGPGLWQEGDLDLGEVPALPDKRFPVAAQRALVLDADTPAFNLSRGAFFLTVPYKDYAQYASDASLCIIERKQGDLKNYQIGQVGKKQASLNGVLLVIAVTQPMV